MILGMVGDLARTTLVPSLYALGCQRLLPEPFALLGVACKTWDNSTFRKATRTYAQEKIGFGDATWQRFAKGLSFVRGGFDAPPTETIPGCVHALRSCRLSTIFPIIYCFISLSRHRSMEKLFTNLLPPRSSRVTALVGGVSVSKSCLAVTLPRGTGSVKCPDTHSRAIFLDVTAGESHAPPQQDIFIARGRP